MTKLALIKLGLPTLLHLFWWNQTWNFRPYNTKASRQGDVAVCILKDTIDIYYYQSQLR